MHYTKYRIFLENAAGARQVLDYELYDTPITFKWMATVIYALENGLPVWGQSVNHRPTAEYAEALFQQMKGLIASTNALRVASITELTHKHHSQVSQAELNDLHQQFHKYEEEVVDSRVYDQTRLNLQELNVLIHRLENALGNLSGDPKYYEQSLLFYFKGQRRVLLEPSDYELFTGENLFGDLLLGYGTTGKNLYQCFLNDDKELLKQRMLRPQTDVSTETLLVFPSHDPEEGSFKLEQTKMIDWAQAAFAEKYGYDLSDPQNINFGLPKLGYLLGNFTNDDIFHLLSDYGRVVKAELI